MEYDSKIELVACVSGYITKFIGVKFYKATMPGGSTYSD